MKNLNKLLSLFLFISLFLSLFFCLIPVSAKITIVDNTAGLYSTRFLDLPNYGVRSFVKTSTDRYIAMYVNATHLVFSYSDDLGSTWNDVLLSNNAWNKIYSYDMCIDGNDNIWFTYLNTSGGWTSGVYRYSSSGVLLYSYVFATDSTAQNDVLAITCDKDNNIYVAVYRYKPFDTSRTYLYRYDYTLQTWSEKSGVPRTYVYAMDTDSNGNLYIFGNSAGVITWTKYTVSTNTITTGNIVLPTLNSQYSMDLAIYDDILYCTYVKSIGGSLAIYLLRGYSPSSMTDDLVYYASGYSYTSPTISVSLDGNIHIVFSGSSSISANTQILNIDNISGSATSLKYYTFGNYNKDCAKLFYQNYPHNIKLSSGFACMYRNVSGLNYLDSSDIIYQSGGSTDEGCLVSTLSKYSTVEDGYGLFAPILYGSTYLPYVEYQVPQFIDGTIKAFDLGVSDEQISDISSSLTDYFLYIDGNYLGNPTNLILTPEHNFILRWCGLNILESTNKPVIEVGCTASVNGVYWKGICINVGGGGWWVHDVSGYFGNGIMDGNNNNQGLTIGYELFYLTENINPNLPDKIRTTDGKTSYNSYDTILFEVTVSRIDIQNYLKIWKDGVRVTEQGYNGNGLFVDALNYDFACNFIPIGNSSSGNYNITLYRDNIEITDFQFTVIQKNPECAIWSYPNPVGSGNDVNIGWLNNVGITLNIVVSLSNAVSYYDVIQSNINSYWGNCTYSFSSDGVYYIYIASIINGTITQYGNVITQYVGIHYNNELHTTKQTYYMSKDSEGVISADVVFYGRQSYIGRNLYIVTFPNQYVSNNLKASVIFTEHIIHYYSGNYVAYLMLWNHTFTGNLEPTDYVILGQINYTVIDYYSGINPNNPDNKEHIFGFEIPTEYAVIIGVILTVVFTLLPLIISAVLSRKTNISVINIPSLVYVGMFLLGVIISVSLTLFPIWVIFFVLFAMILAFAIIWIQRKIAE
jgi:hypothetical protein